MAVGIYLLHLYSGTQEYRQMLLREAENCVDPVRREKAKRLKNINVKAASLGAGMLLQKIVRDRQAGARITEKVLLEEEELLGMLRENPEGVLPLTYGYGEQGKPAILNFPQHFNLSHSGEYVICAVGDGEVGADIQKWIPYKERTAERFFAPEEWKILQKLPLLQQKEMFYRLWTRKEAYGKYTGQGIGKAIGENLAEEEECRRKQIDFREMILEEEYSVAVCYHRENCC